jgi:hypothetical protein
MGSAEWGRSVAAGVAPDDRSREVCPGAESDVAFEGDLATMTVCRRRVVV